MSVELNSYIACSMPRSSAYAVLATNAVHFILDHLENYVRATLLVNTKSKMLCVC